mmetsp:Transcript_17261/g.31833  ORF Transcript_17261/g.31833 Transcript_17261/m.31833 type:complete len:220 (+) Transcript_17261:23-682(+)
MRMPAPCSSIVVVISSITTPLCSQPFPPDAAWTSTAQRRRQCKINVLFAVQPHKERWDIADLPADTDVPLPDECACMVDRLGKTELEDLGLQPALHDLGGCQSKDIIEFFLTFQQQAQADHTTQQCVSLEDTLLAFLVQGEELAGRCANLRKGVLHAPHLTLIFQAILPYDLHLTIQSLLLEWPLRLTEGLSMVLVTFLSHAGKFFSKAQALRQQGIAA